MSFQDIWCELHRANLNSFFTCLGPDLRLIYIDDGSTDKSLCIVSQVLDAKKDYCTIISFTKNRGLTIRLKVP